MKRPLQSFSAGDAEDLDREVVERDQDEERVCTFMHALLADGLEMGVRKRRRI